MIMTLIILTLMFIKLKNEYVHHFTKLKCSKTIFFPLSEVLLPAVIYLKNVKSHIHRKLYRRH